MNSGPARVRVLEFVCVFGQGAFAKVVDCGTKALGAEVFASDREERVVYHTCKSRACPSCGYQVTRAWQRDQWRELPDILSLP